MLEAAMTATASSLAQFMAQCTDEDCVQAWQLICSMRPHLQETVASLLKESPLKRYEGYLNDVNAHRGYGFIVSPEVTLDYGRDAFVSTNETGSFQNKQTVKFTVVWNKAGHPQARLCESEDGTVPLHVHEAFKSLLHSSSEDLPPAKRSRIEMEGQANGVPDEMRRYVGILTAFMPEKHCGFVKCEELYGQYKKDVFVSEDELTHFEVGQMISFRLVLNARGHPQARDVGPPENAQAGPSNAQQWEADALGETTRYVGTVQSFWPEKFCGFLQCPALYDYFKKDVFVGIDEIKGYDIGQSVSFRLVLNAKGNPQARDVGPPEMASPPSTTTKATGGSPQGEERHTGTIQSFIPEKKCGFIHCKALYARYGKDIFVAVDEMGSYSTGDNVSFRLFVNSRGMPQARELGPPAEDFFGGAQAQVVKPPARVVGPPARVAPTVVKPPTASQGFEVDESKRYSGSLQSVMPEKHCGFIHCSELYPTFKKDVFISEEEILSGNFQIGEEISFRVVVSARGHPQARDVGPPEAAPGEFSLPPGLSGLSETGVWSDTGGL